MFDQGLDKNGSPYRSLMMVLTVIGIFLVYSFATQATEVNLEEPLDEKRPETALRTLRALARPDFFTYHEEIRSMDITIRMPCGEEVKGSQTSNSDYCSELCVDDTREHSDSRDRFPAAHFWHLTLASSWRNRYNPCALFLPHR